MFQLPRWVLTNRHPAFHDTESVTAIDMVAKLYGAMQTMIDEYNKFADDTEKKINDFMSDANSDREVFETAMRQEFQDFIDVVELKLQEQDLEIANAKKYMEENIKTTTQNVVNDAIKNGSIVVSEVYNPDTESLDLLVNGGV